MGTHAGRSMEAQAANTEKGTETTYSSRGGGIEESHGVGPEGTGTYDAHMQTHTEGVEKSWRRRGEDAPRCVPTR